MAETVVERLHEDFRALADALDKAALPSLRSTADDVFRKALLLAAASHFEVVVVSALIEFVEAHSGGNTLIAEFVRQKALTRQYHALFDWDSNNANKFFSLFGKPFKDYAISQIRADAELDDAVRAFLEVGRDRNRLVHQDFGNFTLEKTADEIFSSFSRASKFVDALPGLLTGCSSTESRDMAGDPDRDTQEFRSV